MRIVKKMLSLLLAVAMVLSLVPATVIALEPEDMVYISVSEEGQFVSDPNGAALARRAVALEELAAIDLNDYGLSDYLYDKDGDGTYEITALHLYIYTHEAILGLDWRDVDISGGSPGSMYFSAGLFGYEDENLRYNYNGAYPADENGWGFTVDQIVLADGDYLDVAHYSDWMFYSDSAYGFHYFTDSSDAITHAYTVEAESELSVGLILVGGGMGSSDAVTAEAGYTVFYGQSIGDATGSVTTDDSGCAVITFPAAGTWYVWCDGGEGVDMAPGAKVSSPVSAVVTVTEKETPVPPEQPDEAQDVSAVLNATMAQLAATVTEPVFGTTAGEWTVLSLARGGYYAKDNQYFADYYDRIVETVNETAASVSLANGALHKNKSTDNSRLIVALSSIGKDATSVGDWNLITPYEDFDWIKKQGINGAIWALIALDSNHYATADTTIRQQCVDYILGQQLEDGGWTLSGTAADPDITGMTLQALYNYRDQEAVAAACSEAFTCLSGMQLENGGFPYGTGETSESAAQVIVACAIWGINPDTDSRFVKNGKSAVDALLAHYVEAEAMFEHQAGAGSNAMATDQACYALAAYDRLVNGKTALYDYSDVTFDAPAPDSDEMVAVLGLPAKIANMVGTAFNGVITVCNWDNTAGHKLIDLIVSVPASLDVTGVTVGSRLSGGDISYHLEQDTGKLRIVYFDANTNQDLTISGTEPEAELFHIGFQQTASVPTGQKLNISITGMSVKNSADSSSEAAQVVVNTDDAWGVVEASGMSFSAICLYTGDDVDLISSEKKAVAVAVTGIEQQAVLIYDDGENAVEFAYSPEISEKTGVDSYVAMVAASIDMESFINKENYQTAEVTADELLFGDANEDGVVNAQDALSAVNAWLRKDPAPDDRAILALNVNSDSRVNTFDALGIVENFVNGAEFAVVTKAATLTTRQE